MLLRQSIEAPGPSIVARSTSAAQAPGPNGSFRAKAAGLLPGFALPAAASDNPDEAEVSSIVVFERLGLARGAGRVAPLGYLQELAGALVFRPDVTSIRKGVDGLEIQDATLPKQARHQSEVWKFQQSPSSVQKGFP
jgi:hypothetical protein